jgi:hypothetical protein
VLVGHSIHGDLDWLEGMGLRLDFPALDIALAYQEMRGRVQKSRLSAILDDLGVEHPFLHNAGNDALYTLEGAIRLARKIGLQREEVIARQDMI